MDNDGRIRSLNHHAERLLSTSEGDAVGKTYTEVFGDSLSQRVFKLMLRGAAGGQVHLVEATLPDGRRAKLRASAGPLTDGYGNATGIVFVADEDISSPEMEGMAGQQQRLRGALPRHLRHAGAELVYAPPSFVDAAGPTQPGSRPHADVRG